MNAVTQLMGKRHHIAHLALIIEQNIGMDARYGGMGESARRFSGTHRGIDPAIVEETTVSQTVSFTIEEAEPVSLVVLAAVSIAFVVAAAALLVYFKKRKR